MTKRRQILEDLDFLDAQEAIVILMRKGIKFTVDPDPQGNHHFWILYRGPGWNDLRGYRGSIHT